MEFLLIFSSHREISLLIVFVLENLTSFMREISALIEHHNSVPLSDFPLSKMFCTCYAHFISHAAVICGSLSRKVNDSNAVQFTQLCYSLQAQMKLLVCSPLWQGAEGLALRSFYLIKTCQARAFCKIFLIEEQMQIRRTGDVKRNISEYISTRDHLLFILFIHLE